MRLRAGEQAGDPSLAGFPVLRFFGGHWAGKTMALEFPLVTLGRDHDNDLVMDDKGVSRKHCRFVLRAGQVHLLDCQSTNGTYVGGERIDSAVLRDGDEILVGTQVRIRFVVLGWDERELERKLVESANHDSLTKTLSRRAWFEKAEAELKQSLRRNRPVSLALCEVDQFPEVSEKLGQTAGLALLVEFCRRTRSLGREALVGRSGEREFALLLAGFAAPRAHTRMERLCQDVARHPFEVAHEQRFATTVSIGLVTAEHVCSLEHLMSLAQKALEAARLSGQNRVCVETIDSPPVLAPLYSTGLLVLEQKRQMIRKSCLKDIWVISESEDFAGRLLDLGVGGMRVQLERQVKIGQPLEIALAERRERTLSTVVKWQRGGQCGLRFMDPAQALATSWVEDLLGVEEAPEERRQAARVPLQTSMTLRTAALTYECEVLSLGYGGISARAPLTPPVAMEATIEIGRFQAEAVVVWSARGHFGLKFLKLDNQQQHLLHELVKMASSRTVP